MCNDSYKICGGLCRKYRQEHLNVTQSSIAEELGYSQENVSAFENGRNSNNRIFLWYVKHGLFDVYSIDDVCGGCL